MTCSVKKKERGYHESAISQKEGAIVVKWKDNSVVSAASNEFGVNPINQAKRFDRTDKKKVASPQPNLIGQYNKSMVGTDRMDQNVSAYQVAIRIRKWYWPLFTWLLDVCIQNAWLIHRKKHPPLTQLEFKRQVVINYLSTYGNLPKAAGRRRASSSIHSLTTDLRFSGGSQLIAKVPQEKRRRCAGQECKSSVRTMCETCNVGLWSALYHTTHLLKTNIIEYTYLISFICFSIPPKRPALNLCNGLYIY